jgi:3-hydroxyisobutyrate dehydrogenase
MRLINATVAEMTEALARGWEGRDSRVSMLLQQERAGVDFTLDPKDVQAVLDGD